MPDDVHTRPGPDDALNAVTSVHALLDAMMTHLLPFQNELTAKDRKRIHKARRGSEPHITAMAKVARDHPDIEGVSAVDAAAMESALRAAAASEFAAGYMEVVAKILRDLALTLRSGAWLQALHLYRTTRATHGRADVAAACRAFEDFMRTGPRKAPPKGSPGA